LWADLSEHTEREIGWARTTLRRFLLKTADSVIVNGQSGARYIRGLGVRAEKIVVAPYTAPVKLFDEIPMPRDKNADGRLLVVGQMIESKGLQLFVQSLCRWNANRGKARCEVWFVGDGPLRGNLQQIIQRAGISARFVGAIPYEDLPKYYRECSFLAFPTLSDTWGLVVNEALASGLPVLGSVYSQSVQELVRDGYNGWIFKPDSYEETSRMLDHAYGTAPLDLARMRVNARHTTLHLTPEFQARQFSAAIAIAIGETNGRISR
jgi:glycosyltransferase involved in cell wall biosynthesis